MGRGERDHLEEGASVWVRDPDEAWVRGVLAERRVDGHAVVRTESGKKIHADLKDIEFCSTTPRQEVKVDDLTQLPDLHQAALLNTLHVRFEADKIYTFSGEVLIAVNPFKRIRGLYEPKSMTKYINAGVGEVELLDPHAYRVAGAAYRAMTTYSGRNQSILVSGESGAGKTYNTKVLLSYLTVVSSGDPARGLDELRTSIKRSSKRMPNSVGASVAQRVLEANPLMEAFGNAKTLRNDNSSRFGKLIELEFENKSTRLMGAAIDVYLLEKARVVHQQDGERNYHIFYEMDAGLTDEEKDELIFPEIHYCRYIESSTFERADIDDLAQWKLTRAAFDILGFSDDERIQVLRVMSAVLHLGNITFESHNTDGAEGSKVSSASMDSAKDCAMLLGIEVSDLIKALTTRGMSIGGGGFLAALSSAVTETLTKQHTVSQAEEAREALAMALYERTFGWIVWRINEAIGVSTKTSQAARAARKSRAANSFQLTLGRSNANNKGETQYYNDHSIGVLDIFGFEVFASNGFEQLMINYTNERLQNQFNEHIFKLEAALFESEGLDWSVIDWPDNQLTLDMIETRPIGLLSLLDETCLMGSGTDKAFVSKLYQNLAKGKFAPVFSADRNQQVRYQFEIAHFAGPVVYSSDNFIAKNKNELRSEAVDLLRSSDDAWLSVLMPPDASAAGGGSDAQEYFSQLSKKPKNLRSSLQRHRQNSPQSSRLQQKTVSSHFRTQLSVAINHINASQPHYIRCIKPNDLNVENEFDRIRVEEQLAYSGVLEVVRVARAGYPTRFTLKEFADRFHVLSVSRSSHKRHSKSRRRRSSIADPRKVCERIVKTAGLEDIIDYQIGFTKVFLKPYAYTTLELRKAEKILKYVLILQRSIRVYLRTYRATKKVRAAKIIQRNFRGYRVRREVGAFRQERRSAIAIQRMARGVLARKRVKPLIAKRLADDTRRRESAAARIKRAYRRKVLKDRLREIREESVRQRSAIMLQSLARVLKAQKLANNMYAERVTDDAARTLQGLARIVAAKKTREMLEQERDEEEEEQPNLFLLYVGPLAVLFLFTQPVLMLGVAGVLAAMVAGAGMALEAEQRQKLFQKDGARYTRRARRHRRRYGDYDDNDDADLYDDDDDYLDGDDETVSEISDDLEFFNQNKNSSRKLTQQLTRRKEPMRSKPAASKPARRSPMSSLRRLTSSGALSQSERKASFASPRKASVASRRLVPARKGLSSQKDRMGAYDDYDVYFSDPKKKPTRRLRGGII